MKIGDMKEILERYSSKDWSKRQESKIRACRMPPKRLMEFGKIMLEAVSKWYIIVRQWKVDIAL